MSDIHNQDEVELTLQSGRFKILSENNEYKDFSGVASGVSREYLYSVDGNLYTEDHIFIDNGKEVPAKFVGATTEIKAEVYEILNVKDTHTYMSNGRINKNCLILDEFAFIDKGASSSLADEFIKSVFPTISSAKDKSNSKIIIISTPNGMNAFYRIWHKASIGKNDFIPFKIDWRTVPRSVGPDEFKQNQVNVIGDLAFQQEYECVAHDTMVTLKDEETGQVIHLTIEEADILLKQIIESD
jgi:hypothetical protein